jgi:multidrug resistance efflux pump
MNHKRPPIPVIVILVLVVLTAGYFGIRTLLTKSSNVLTASGTIEAVEVTISPEIGGKVAEVLVDESASVKNGDVLFRLDDSMLQAQRAVAAASLSLAQASALTAEASQVTAQANYNLAADVARQASAASRTTDWRASGPVGYTLPGGYFSASDQIAAAEAVVNVARAAQDSGQQDLNKLLTDPAGASFVAAETRLVNARAAYIVAQNVLLRADPSNNTDLRDAAQTARDNAKTELDDAQSAYDALKDSDIATKIITARAELSAAQESFEAAQDSLLALQTGSNSPQLAAALAVLEQAHAAPASAPGYAVLP